MREFKSEGKPRQTMNSFLNNLELIQQEFKEIEFQYNKEIDKENQFRNYLTNSLTKDFSKYNSIKECFKEIIDIENKYDKKQKEIKAIQINKMENLANKIHMIEMESNISKVKLLQEEFINLQKQLNNAIAKYGKSFLTYSFYILANESDEFEIIIFTSLTSLLVNKLEVNPEEVKVIMENYDSLIEKLISFDPNCVSIEIANYILQKIKKVIDLIDPESLALMNSKLIEVYRHLLPISLWIQNASKLVILLDKLKDASEKSILIGIRKLNKCKKIDQVKSMIRQMSEDAISPLKLDLEKRLGFKMETSSLRAQQRLEMINEENEEFYEKFWRNVKKELNEETIIFNVMNAKLSTQSQINNSTAKIKQKH